VPTAGDVALAADTAGCEAPVRGSAARAGAAPLDGDPECDPVCDPPPSGMVGVFTGTDGVPTEGVVIPGVATVGVLAGGVTTLGVVTGGTVTDGTVADGTLTDGTVTAGTLTEGTLSEGTLTDGTEIVDPSATAVDAPTAATTAAHATRTPLNVQLLTPAPRTVFPQ
jgi:hypothetical protein